MNTEQNNNQNFETILSTDEHIICKRNHVRYHTYLCGIVAGLLMCLYSLTFPLKQENLNATIVIGGLLLCAIFLIRLVLEKKMLIEKANGARLILGKKYYPLTDEKKLKSLVEDTIESAYGLPTEDPNGGVILEYARTKEGDILYLKAIRWNNMIYTTTIETKRLEGEQAKNICKNLKL